jgi:hypothetical protein
LWPEPTASAVVDLTPWWCLSCGPAGTADQFQNVLLFLPLGIAAARAGWSARRTTVSVTAFTVAIELLQGVLGQGRDAALGDVLANALGGVLGWWVVQLGGRRLPQVERWAPSIGVGLFIALFVATSSLDGPRAAGPEPWRLRLQPRTADRPPYQGAVIHVALGGRTILTEEPRPGQPITASAPAASARFVWAPPQGRQVTAIARLDDGRGWPIVAVDRRNDGVAISVRTSAAAMRLRNPSWQVDVPPSVRPGDTLDLSLSLGRSSASIVLSTSAGVVDTTRYRRGAQHGWAMINPFVRQHDSPQAWRWWTIAWLLGWGMLLGLTALPAHRPAIWLGAALLGLLVTTWLGGAPAQPAELGALALGWMLARVTGRWFRPASPVA